WEGHDERSVRDVPSLSVELASGIAQAAGASRGSPGGVPRPATVDPSAYEAYLQGRSYSARGTADDLARAEGSFQDAIARDPKYAPAYAGLSEMSLQLGARGLPPREFMPRAAAAARLALARDDTLAEAHTVLADVLYRYEWDWEGAEREFQKSLEL